MKGLRIPTGKPTRKDRGIYRKPKYQYDPSQTRQRLVRITMQDGVETGMILRDGYPNVCAPDISYMVNWDMPRLRQYCNQHNLKIDILPYYQEGDEEHWR